MLSICLFSFYFKICSSTTHRAKGIEEVKAEDDLLDAINFLVNLDPENSCRIIICGSLYLARDFILFK